MTIAIVDYGVGNLRSVQKAVEHAGHSAVITSDPQTVRDVHRVILPGVGAFGAAVTRLHESGLADVVLDTVKSGKPLLGICVGMQLLMTRSLEMGEWAGLNVVPGDVVRFENGDYKVPQIGWNRVLHQKDSPLFLNVPEDMMFYFVHSYYCCPARQDVVAGITDYSVDYCSVFSMGNVHAAQFHPEKSGRAGLQFLRNFAEMPA